MGYELIQGFRAICVFIFAYKGHWKNLFPMDLAYIVGSVYFFLIREPWPLLFNESFALINFLFEDWSVANKVVWIHRNISICEKSLATANNLCQQIGFVIEVLRNLCSSTFSFYDFLSMIYCFVFCHINRKKV